MTKSYTLYLSRRDRALVVLTAADDAAALKRDVCSNAVTGYVRVTETGGIMVPRHAAEAVAQHLARFGWTRSNA